MKKIIIVLLFLSLVFPSGGLAADRAVVEYIISEEWYNNLFLIADKKGNMAYQNFTVQVGDGGGHEELYHFPNWYNDKFTPSLFHEDINGDSLKDIVVILISGSGVSLSTKEIHVLNQVKDQTRRFAEVPVESINDAVQRLVKIKQKDNKISISIGNKNYVVDYSKFSYYTPVDTPRVGSIENYHPENNILYGYTTVFVTIPEASIGQLKVRYKWDGKKYKAESVTFLEKQK